MNEDYKEKVLDFYHRNRRMPSYQEIMHIVGFKSKNAVYKLVNKLIEEGVVRKDDKGRLLPTESMDEIPFLGLVEAGFPTLAGEIGAETMSLDSYLIKDKISSYLLEVKGDSMIEAGINEGDLVLVQKIKGLPKEGDIVIAEVDGGWTMKYFHKRGTQVVLEPANKNYKTIVPEYSLNITAVVKGVIRKY